MGILFFLCFPKFHVDIILNILETQFNMWWAVGLDKCAEHHPIKRDSRPNSVTAQGSLFDLMP